MEKKEFLRCIQACRRKLNTRDFLHKLVVALGIGAIVGVLFQNIAFLIPVYYVNLYSALALILAGITAVIMALWKRNSMKQAALVMDSFGFQERIITAYEHLEEDGNMYRLQREDAMRRLATQKERIKIPLLPSWKKLAVPAGLFVLLVILACIPSPMKEKAKELHELEQLAKEKAEEVEEVAEALEALEQEALQEEALTPEQLAALQQMMESLQNSMEEIENANSMEGLTAAGEKLEYKYENMSEQLSALASALQMGATPSTMTAESMQQLAENLQEMSGSVGEGSQQLANNQGQNGNNGSQGGNDGQNGQNGQSGNNQGNQQGNSGQNGQNGSGDGGNGSGNDSGNGSGDGNGDGNGDGDGSGSGTGTGNGESGNGRGTGSANIPRDYVSIPNAIANSENLTGNASNHDTSQYFKTQNGVSWEGERIPYESVIGSYEQNAYEGIAADRYPSGMEDVIKEYFSSFN